MVVSVSAAPGVGYYSGGGGEEASTESYYLDAVAEGEPAGFWSGAGAARLGLTGEVTPDEMEAVFETFTNPRTGEAIGRRPPTADARGQEARLAERIETALAAEPDALPERREEIRRDVENATRPANRGWDLTFNVAKSVTIAHTAAHRAEIAAVRAGDQETAAKFAEVRLGIEQAIMTANATMLDYASTMTTVRTGGGAGTPVQWVSAPGLVHASFLQHTTRPTRGSGNIDPHLHVHNVTLNRAYSADGKARALDGRDVLDGQYTFSAIADRVLEEALTAQGFEVALRPDGLARELTIVPAEVCDLFSSRSQEIDAKLTELHDAAVAKFGRQLSDLEFHNLKQFAALATRESKSHTGSPETRDEMVDRWASRMISEVGNTLDSLAGQISTHLDTRQPLTLPGADGTAAEITWSPHAVAAEALAACSQDRATWSRHFLTAELAHRLPSLGGLDPKSTVELLERFTDEVLAGAEVRQVSGLDLPGLGSANGTHDVDALEQTGGPLASLAEDPFSRPGARRYATVTAIEAEEALRQAGITRGRHALAAEQVSDWLDANCPTIGADQRAAVTGLATSDAALTVLVGPAGTGKSYAAGALAGMWSDLTGGEAKVVGLAVSQVATTVLQDDGIEHARNITQWLSTQDRIAAASTAAGADSVHADDRAWALGPRDVVMVDEASMVSTADLTRIRETVEAAGARMVLTGDPHQLGAVEAGGAMGLVDGHAETYTLSDVRRFTNSWERDASLALRDGQPDALNEYDRHGRLLTHASTDAAVEAAARAAVADRLDDRSVVVVAGTNDQAAAISTKVRDQLVELGIVDTSREVMLGRDRCTAGVGDLVTARRNDHANGVTNRVQYRVLDVHDDGSLTVAPLTRGAAIPAPLVDRRAAAADAARPGPGEGSLRLQADYVADHVQLGYASTVHAAQGLTVDSAHLVTDGDLDSNALYVALTRGRTRNTAHVAGTRNPGDAPYGQAEPEEALPARAVLASCLERDGTTRAAIVEHEQDLERLSSMRTLAGRVEVVTQLACRERMDRHLDDLTARGVLDDDTRAQLGADQSSDHLARLLRAVEQAGQDPRTVLEAAVKARGLSDAASVAQVLSHRITGGRPVPPPLLTQAGTPRVEVDDQDAGATQAAASPSSAAAAVVPEGIDPRAAAQLAVLNERIDARRGVLGAGLAERAPSWAVEAFGPVPDPGTTARDVWEARAGVVAGHREATGWEHEHRPIGSFPGLSAPERRASFAAAWEALGRPEAGLDEAQMTEGQLRVRIRAADSERLFAPANVDRSLRANETAHEHARHAAALATAAADRAEALGQLDEAARLREEAAAHAATLDEGAAVVERLTEIGDTRGAWVAHSAVTLEQGARAKAEAEERGIDIGAEPDRLTPEDYLAHEQAGIAADDEHRTITETDIADADQATTDDQVDEQTAPPQREAADATHDVEADADDDELDLVEADADEAEVGDTGLEVGGLIDRDEPAPVDEAVDEEADSLDPVDEPVTGAQVEVPDRVSRQELELYLASSALTVDVIADRESEEAAHVDPELEEAHAAVHPDTAADLADAEREHREAIDYDTGVDSAGIGQTLTAAAADSAGFDD